MQSPQQVLCFGVFRDWVVGSEDYFLCTACKVDGFADLLGKPLNILLRVSLTPCNQSGNVSVDIRVFVNELGNVLKPWVAKVAEDHCQSLSLVCESVKCQRMRAGQVPRAERCVPRVETHREPFGLGVLV